MTSYDVDLPQFNAVISAVESDSEDLVNAVGGGLDSSGGIHGECGDFLANCAQASQLETALANYFDNRKAQFESLSGTIANVTDATRQAVTALKAGDDSMADNIQYAMNGVLPSSGPDVNTSGSIK